MKIKCRMPSGSFEIVDNPPDVLEVNGVTYRGVKQIYPLEGGKNEQVFVYFEDLEDPVLLMRPSLHEDISEIKRELRSLRELVEFVFVQAPGTSAVMRFEMLEKFNTRDDEQRGK